MRKLVHALVLSIAAVTLGIPRPASADDSTEIPVKAVTLYSSGVGFFQHSGTVTGNATTVLPFNVAQINDVLKSLVLEDKGGQVVGVTYASQDPLAKTLKSFQVDITGNPTLDQLLNQLRGSKLTVNLAAEQVSGVILGVEGRVRPAGENKTYDVHILNLLTSGSIRAIDLTEIHDVHLDDPELQDELSKALAAVAASRDQDKRPVTIHFQGQGQREVLLGYVIETPVWKTSYRLVLGDKDDAKIQGWAIVENQTDSDWNDVQLSLVSGRPISFVEDLYQPLYVPRPTVTPQLYSSLRPPIYEEGTRRMAGAVQMQSDLSAKAPGGELSDTMNAAAAAAPQQTINPTASVVSAASAEKLGELFQYTIGDVTLPRQSSSMIPIVTDSIQAQRVSIYNPAIMPRNPLNGARLKNTTGKHLLGGPMTILDAGAYAGDAQIDNLPPDQDRLISFGIDLQMLVDTTTPGNTDDILTGKIVNGVLQVSHKYVTTTVYDAENKSDHDKQLVIEHAFRPGWDLIDTVAPVEKTPQLYRFQESVPAGKSAQLTVKEQQIADEGFVILDGDVDSVVAFSHNGAIPKDVKEALAKAAEMKGAIVAAQNRLNQDKQDESAIVVDQQRINETLRTIDRTTALYSRLLTKLNDQETQLEKLRADEDDATKQLNDASQQLRDFLTNLNVG